jgi:thiol-disulfide isomerase/thioredoxin
MRRRTHRWLPVVTAVAALVLAACGSDDPAEPQQQPGPDPTTQAPAPSANPADGEEAEVPDSLAFTGTTVAGESFDAAELAGEPVVLWFWAPWCPICRSQAPDVLAAAEQVTVVGVGGLDEASAMQGFVDDTSTGELTHLSDPDGQIWQKFGVETQYTYVLIDASGEVTHTGPLQRQELLDRVGQLAA